MARSLTSLNGFALGVLHSTRADIRLLGGRAEEALADAERAIAHLTAHGEPNPYVFGITVRAEVQALMTLGRLDDAQEFGEGALGRLGDRVPQARSLILQTVAEALKEAGRVAEAYEALERSGELERQAFRELSELQLGLERATLETGAARREADALAEKNRELEAAVRALADAREQLREQADRDWLTGLHNRRLLARELDRLTREPLDDGPMSVAVLDLDHFKSINDRFGHQAGDHVLIRVAELLLDVLRHTDVVVRTGGEEFVLLMPATDEGAARTACERVRHAIRDEAWERVADGLVVTASVGMASQHEPGPLETLVQLADRRLYAAKAAGRDCVVARG